MPAYRIYRLTPDQHIVGVPEVVERDSDQDVIAHAKPKLDGLDIEIWNGCRLRTQNRAPQLASFILAQRRYYGRPSLVVGSSPNFLPLQRTRRGSPSR